MAVKKLANLLGYPVGTPVTGNPELFNTEEFDLPSRGSELPSSPSDGDAHYFTPDRAIFRWDATRGVWLNDQTNAVEFAAPGANVGGSPQPEHLLGAAGTSLIKAYPLIHNITLTGVTVVTPDATHDGFDVKLGTLAVAAGLTDHFDTVSVAAAAQFLVKNDMNFNMAMTDMGDAPGTDALSALIDNVGVSLPDDVHIRITFQRRPSV